MRTSAAAALVESSRLGAKELQQTKRRTVGYSVDNLCFVAAVRGGPWPPCVVVYCNDDDAADDDDELEVVAASMLWSTTTQMGVEEQRARRK